MGSLYEVWILSREAPVTKGTGALRSEVGKQDAGQVERPEEIGGELVGENLRSSPGNH